ncbi:XkdX family protein [Acetanaerobacterium elongatum]|uniref:Phage uncharacterized protein (Phage_XkdX) n=1 Tax=Acetanaerobacterium elongatum TaxID=258515 RepID=A0A1H0EAE9_9FIRM|nr:XkdX family protein [Acetanaerobacterium elongatum]SDN79404.1 Phage uncharacterised protein (Phage_XkdX) [Acetanaerobacterium elongatum]
MTYETVKKNYDNSLWNRKMVKVAVVKGVITPEEYKKITGEKYEKEGTV